MTLRDRLVVASISLAGGLAALAVFVLTARPEADTPNLAIGALVFVTAAILVAPRAREWVTSSQRVELDEQEERAAPTR